MLADHLSKCTYERACDDVTNFIDLNVKLCYEVGLTRCIPVCCVLPNEMLKTKSHYVNLKLYGAKLEHVTTCRYLVIVLDNKLELTPQYVLQKLHLLAYAIRCVINYQMVSTKLAYILHLYIRIGYNI